MGSSSLKRSVDFVSARCRAQDLRDVANTRKFVELTALELSMQHMNDAWHRRVRAAYADFCQVKQRVGDSKPISED